MQMVGVAQDDLRARALDLRGVQAAHRTVGSHRHERGGFHDPVGQDEAAGARVAVRCFWREVEHGGKIES